MAIFTKFIRELRPTTDTPSDTAIEVQRIDSPDETFQQSKGDFLKEIQQEVTNHTHSHVSLTGITPDDHHAKLHDLPSHTDVAAGPFVPGNLLIYDGAKWIPFDSYGSSMIVQEAKPDESLYKEGQEWLRTTDMIKFTLYVDVDSRQWVRDLNGGTGVPGPVGPIGPASNGENVLINGDFRVNQRRFDGDWLDPLIKPGDHGFDHWKASGAGTIIQIVEDINLLVGAVYTLSWEHANQGTKSTIHVAGGAVVTGTSGISILNSKAGDAVVVIPAYAYNVKLELGSVPTPFQPRLFGEELALCQRYYYRINDPASFYAYHYGEAAASDMFMGLVTFPVTMHRSPDATTPTPPTYVNCSNQTIMLEQHPPYSSAVVRVNVVANGKYRAFGGDYVFDAEII